MPAKMADCLVGKMALMRASLAGGQMAVRGAAQWVGLVTVELNWVGWMVG